MCEIDHYELQRRQDADEESIVLLGEEIVTLKQKNTELQARLLHSEAFDETASIFEYGENRTWEVLTKEQKQYWIDAIAEDY